MLILQLEMKKRKKKKTKDWAGKVPTKRTVIASKAALPGAGQRLCPMDSTRDNLCKA
jgi:hypothetical protein